MINKQTFRDHNLRGQQTILLTKRHILNLLSNDIFDINYIIVHTHTHKIKTEGINIYNHNKELNKINHIQ